MPLNASFAPLSFHPPLSVGMWKQPLRFVATLVVFAYSLASKKKDLWHGILMRILCKHGRHTVREGEKESEEGTGSRCATLQVSPKVTALDSNTFFPNSLRRSQNKKKKKKVVTGKKVLPVVTGRSNAAKNPHLQEFCPHAEAVPTMITTAYIF